MGSAEQERDLARQAWQEAQALRLPGDEGMSPERYDELVAKAHAHELEALRLELDED